jgi:hypothetical protein
MALTVVLKFRDVSDNALDSITESISTLSLLEAMYARAYFPEKKAGEF